MAEEGSGAVAHVPLKDRLWARVLGGAILTLATGITLDKLKVLPIGDWIASAAMWLWVLVTTTYKLPAWLTWLLITGCVTFLVRTVIAYRKSKAITFQRYNEDTFLDLRWKWQYGQDGKMTGIKNGSITPYCPKCGVRMNTASLEYGRGNVAIITVSCLACDHAVKVTTGPTSDVRERIAGLVEREITTGNWKKKLSPETPAVTIWY
jgi:hypothetical protein